MKKLILSNLSKFDINDKDNVYLGPWCFLKKKKFSEILNDNSFNASIFSNYNRDDCKYLIDISEKLLIKLSDKFNDVYDTKFSVDYWRALISMPIILFVQSMYEKSKILDEFKENNFFVEIISKHSIPPFKKTSDLRKFLNSNLGHHILCSIIVNNNKNYKLKQIKIKKKNIKTNLLIDFIQYAEILINFIISYFTNVFIFKIKSINFFDKIKIRSKKRFFSNKDELTDIKKNIKSIKKINIKKNNIQLFDSPQEDHLFNLIANNINFFLPEYMFKNFKKRNIINFLLIRTFRLHQKNIIIGPVLGGYDKLKFILGILKNIKTPINIYQHGGYYGTAESFTLMAYAEYYISDRFISWGWNHHSNYKVNTTKLPNPFISKLINSKKSFNKLNDNKILYISTESPLYGTNIGSVPHPYQFSKFNIDKLNILNLLNNISHETFFRPYLNSELINDEINYIKEKYKNIKIYIDDIDKNLTKFDLIILDHPSTLMNYCLGANLPVKIFLNDEIWNFTNAFNDIYSSLIEDKIVFNNFDLFKDNILSIIENDELISRNNKKNNSVKSYSNQYARHSNNWSDEWIEFSKNINKN